VVNALAGMAISIPSTGVPGLAILTVNPDNPTVLFETSVNDPVVMFFETIICSPGFCGSLSGFGTTGFEHDNTNDKNTKMRSE
jgi:hypothetical protein